MNYGVRYDIIVNEKASVEAMNNFASTVERVTPKIVKDLRKINNSLSDVTNKINSLNVAFKNINSLNLSRVRNEVAKTKREFDKLKSKTVTITTRMVDGGQTTSTSTTSGTGRTRGVTQRGPAFSKIGGMSSKQMLPTSFLAGLSVPLITMGATALFGRFIRDMIQESSAFEDTMTSVRNILRTTDKDAATFEMRFKTVSDHMQQIGVDTKFTSLEIAGAAKYLAMAGQDLSTIDASMRPIANLAALSDTPIDKVADVVTNIMAGYGIGAKDIAATSDIIASAATSTNTSVLEMAESFKFAARPLQMAGINFNEAAATIGILANAGVKGTLAGTAIRAMMIRLTAPTKKAQAAIDRLGVSLTEVVDGKQKIRDLSDIFKDFRKAGASVADMYTIFDKIAGGASTAVFQSLLQLDYLTDKTANAGGIAQFLAEEKMKTVVGLWDQITSQIKYLNQSVFDSIQPSIKQYQTQFLNWLKSPDARDTFMQVGQFIKEGIELAKTFFSLIYDNFSIIKNFVIGKFIFNRLIGIANLIGSVTSYISALLTASATASATTAATASSIGALGTLGSAAVMGVTGLIAGLGVLAYNGWRASKNANDLIDSFNNADVRFVTLEKLNNNLKSIEDRVKSIKTTFEQDISKQLEGARYRNKGWFASAIISTGKFFQGGGRGIMQTKAEVDLLEKEIIPKQIAPRIAQEAIGDLYSKAIGAESDEDFKKTIASIRSIGASYWTKGTKSIYDANTDFSIDLSSEGFLYDTKEANQSASNYILDIANAQELIRKNWTSGNESGILKAMQSIGVIKSATIDALKYADGSDFDPAKIRKIYQGLVDYGLTNKSIMENLKTIGVSGELTSTVTPEVEFSPRITSDNKTVDDVLSLDGYSTSGSGAKIRGGGSKNIIVNIQNLMNVESANLEGDLSALKDKIAQALMDTVKDFEIGIS